MALNVQPAHAAGAAAATAVDVDGLVQQMKDLAIRAAAVNDLQAALDEANERITALEEDLAAAQIEAPSTLTMYRTLTAAWPLHNLAARPNIAPLLATKELAAVAALLNDDDVDAIKAIAFIAADGKISYGTGADTEASGWRNTVALALVLLHNMSDDHLVAVQNVAESQPCLNSGLWSASHKRLTESYSSSLQELEGVHAAVVGGEAKVFQYVKVAAFMLIARMLLTA